MPEKAMAAGRGFRAWRSDRLARLVAGFNRRAEESEPADASSTKDSRRGFLIGAAALTVVAIAVRAPLFGTAYVAPDTSAYLSVAESIFHGGFPDNVRPPAYPLLLAIFKELGANPVTAVVDLQNLVGIFLPAAVLFLGRRFFNNTVGLVAGFLTAASPLMIITEQIGLAEFIFGVLLLVATALLVEACSRVRTGRATWKLLGSHRRDVRHRDPLPGERRARDRGDARGPADHRPPPGALRCERRGSPSRRCWWSSRRGAYTT